MATRTTVILLAAAVIGASACTTSSDAPGSAGSALGGLKTRRAAKSEGAGVDVNTKSGIIIQETPASKAAGKNPGGEKGIIVIGGGKPGSKGAGTDLNDKAGIIIEH